MDDLRRALALLDNPAGVNVMAKKGRAIINTHATNLDALAHRIEILHDWDVYACLNPASTRRGKPCVEDITEVRRFMVDIDPIDDDGIPIMLQNRAMYWLWENYGHDVDFTTISSGRGMQLWVEVEPTTECRRAAAGIRGVVRAMANHFQTVAGCRIDTTSAEISRVARLPGTVNSKTGKMAWIISKEDGLPRKKISVSGLDKWAEPEYDAGPSLPVPDNVDAILPALPPWSRDFALFGADSRTASRHGRGYALVSDLAGLGVPQDTARVMLSVACSRCKPALTDSSWMDRTINAHY